MKHGVYILYGCATAKCVGFPIGYSYGKLSLRDYFGVLVYRGGLLCVDLFVTQRYCSFVTCTSATQLGLSLGTSRYIIKATGSLGEGVRSFFLLQKVGVGDFRVLGREGAIMPQGIFKLCNGVITLYYKGQGSMSVIGWGLIFGLFGLLCSFIGT